MCRILDTDGLSAHDRSIDQIRFNDLGQSHPTSAASSGTNDIPLATEVVRTNFGATRNSIRPQRKPNADFRNPEFHLPRGRCDDCNCTDL